MVEKYTWSTRSEKQSGLNVQIQCDCDRFLVYQPDGRQLREVCENEDILQRAFPWPVLLATSNSQPSWSVASVNLRVHTENRCQADGGALPIPGTCSTRYSSGSWKHHVRKKSKHKASALARRIEAMPSLPGSGHVVSARSGARLWMSRSAENSRPAGVETNLRRLRKLTTVRCWRRIGFQKRNLNCIRTKQRPTKLGPCEISLNMYFISRKQPQQIC